jgi:EAL domain-containing protein (putative c-di-GMP-specific phosphodiesterase class I)
VADLAEPLHVAGRPVYAQASIGIAGSGPGCTSASVMVRRADMAMYHAKREKANGWRVYVDELADSASSAAALQADLRTAVRAGQLRLQYQPLVALASGLLTGFEVLVRWEHPTRGWLAPTSFVPLAEAQGIIGELDQWVLENACTQVADWQRRLPPGRRLALNVNLSPRGLHRDCLVESILDTVRQTGFDPTGLVLEVTERALVDETAIPGLATLGGHGVRVALDDFGTGYSSLRHLTRLPVDIVKLDRCFVAELNGTKEGAAVAEAVARLSQVLKLEAVAEGIESRAQADELRLLGYRSGQGYHFARPLHAEDVEGYVGRGVPMSLSGPGRPSR